MKKIIALLVAVFALFSLCACSHTHTIDEWSVDYIGHWHICTECGEKLNYTAHVNQTGYEFNNGDVCIVCNSTVTLNNNGNTVVTVHDNDGNVVRELVFDKNGTLIKEN